STTRAVAALRAIWKSDGKTYLSSQHRRLRPVLNLRWRTMRSSDKGSIPPLFLVAAAFGILLFAATTSGCTGTDRQDDGKIVVAVTIPPQQEFVERVGGDHVRVVLLVPPGADPHTYEPTPGVLADVSEADLYAVVGSGIEFELA